MHCKAEVEKIDIWNTPQAILGVFGCIFELKRRSMPKRRLSVNNAGHRSPVTGPRGDSPPGPEPLAAPQSHRSCPAGKTYREPGRGLRYEHLNTSHSVPASD